MKVKLLLISLFLFGMFSCEQAFTPKPRGYFRIDFPEKQYVLFDTAFPYSFEYPVYSKITGDPHSPNEKYWINLNFPEYKATVHISYKPVNGNLATYLEDAHTLVTKHIEKADAISDSLIIDRGRNLFGLAYTLEGSGAASPYQFFLTDSSSNFVRGALYFNTVPNNDSLEPVIDFIKKDIVHLFNTFHWKELENK
jgi:gliding motility-associated lipoprotein GldD